MSGVKGHYKTFTADAPLMGKHVGRFWWSGPDRPSGPRPSRRRVRVSDQQLTLDLNERIDSV